MTANCKQRLRPRWGCLFLVGLVAAAISSGCGAGGPARYDLSGTVTHKGQPVPRGYLVFEPDAAAGNAGPGAQADIRDGRFATSPGQGTIGGPHTVSISGFDGRPFEIPNSGGMQNPMGRPLFPTQELKIDLPKEAAEREIAVGK